MIGGRSQCLVEPVEQIAAVARVIVTWKKFYFRLVASMMSPRQPQVEASVGPDSVTDFSLRLIRSPGVWLLRSDPSTTWTSHLLPFPLREEMTSPGTLAAQVETAEAP